MQRVQFFNYYANTNGTTVGSEYYNEYSGTSMYKIFFVRIKNIVLHLITLGVQ